MNNDSLISHLEELRKRIICSLFTILIFSVISFFFKEKILSFLTKPLGQKLIYLSPYGGFLSLLKISLGTGFILSIPFILYHTWKFISPGLYPQEQKISVYIIFGTFFFFLGASFFFFLLLPYLIKFFLSTPELKPMLEVNKYISFILMFIIIFGIIFELPLIIIILTKFGIVTSETLSKKRHYFVLVIFILAALITPPDVISQLILSFPLILIFELSLIMSKIFTK